MMGLLLFAGCTELQEPAEGLSNELSGGLAGPQDFISTKVVNSPLGAVEGMLMVKSNREGMLDLTGVPALNITSVKPAFLITDANRERMETMGLDRWYVVGFDKGTSLSLAAQSVSECSNVDKIQFNKRLVLSESGAVVPADEYSVPVVKDVDFDDPLLMYQWHYNNVGNTAIAATVRKGADINVKDAWGLTGGDPDVVVAVLDRGVQYSHPDLEANMWVNEAELNGIPGKDDDGNGYVDDIYGYNFVTDGPITWDKDGDSHGTHVAGTVAAVNNNGIGVCGVAGGTGNGDGARIMSCQIFDGNNGGDILTMARAMVYAADMGAAIAQGSFGFTSGTYTTDEDFEISCNLEVFSLEYFMTYGGGDVINGGLAIFAAGNEGGPYASYPGAYTECICVGSIGPDYLPAAYTNYGPGTNILAPGGDYSVSSNVAAMVLSTMPGGEYGYEEGTSMACPHVSGVAALGLSYAKKLGIKYNRNQFTTLLLSSVNDIDKQLDREKAGMNLYDYRGKLGTGLIDAWKLLMRIEGTPSIIAPIGREAWIDLSPYMGGSSQQHQEYALIDVEFSSLAKKALGIEETPSVEHGKLKVKCTKQGSAKVKVTFYIDYKLDAQGQPVDEKKLTREISIMSRGVATSNGGWL